MGTTTLEFRLSQKSSTTWTMGSSSLSDSLAFADSVQPLTNAAISRVGFTVSADRTADERTDDFADMSLFGMAFFRNADNKLVKFVWPAPRRDLFVLESSRYILKQSAGDTLAEALGTLKGETLTFKHGGVSSRD